MRVSRFVAFDLDGTLLTCNSSFAFCQYLRKRKVLSVTQLFYCAFRYFVYKRGLISLDVLQKNVFHTLFKGKQVEELRKHVDSFLHELVKHSLNKLVFNRLQEALKRGDHVALLSNSPLFLVEPLAKKWQIPFALGSEYQVDTEGCLWDIAFIIDGNRKVEYLKQAVSSFPIPITTVAYSDHRADLPLLEAVDKAIVVNPDQYLRRLALSRDWEIIG